MVLKSTRSENKIEVKNFFGVKEVLLVDGLDCIGDSEESDFTTASVLGRPDGRRTSQTKP